MGVTLVSTFFVVYSNEKKRVEQHPINMEQTLQKAKGIAEKWENNLYLWKTTRRNSKRSVAREIQRGGILKDVPQMKSDVVEYGKMDDNSRLQRRFSLFLLHLCSKAILFDQLKVNIVSMEWPHIEIYI